MLEYMRGKSLNYLFFLLLSLFLAVIASCQKDNDVKEPVALQAHTTDSVSLSDASSPDNLLASAGTLKVSIGDSVYTFDASRDSIAFINVHTDNEKKYFGITAINKEHTLSFGISAAGVPSSNITKGVAGSQFLLSPADKTPYRQYSLSRFSAEKDMGNINLVQYHQRRELAKGTFNTILAKDDKAGSVYYKVAGTFDLQIK
jgi:hypothetical protein